MTAIDPGERQGVLGDHVLFGPAMALPQERAALRENSEKPLAGTAFTSVMDDPLQRIQPRSPIPLNRDSVAQRVQVSPTLAVTERIQGLWDQGVQESRELAGSFAHLAPSWLGRDAHGCTPEDADCEDLLVSTVLRCSENVAHRRIREAHRAVDLCPRTFARLDQGDFPAPWFRELLRRSTELTDDEMLLLDSTVCTWDTGITSEHFGRCLGTVITALLSRRELPPHLCPESRRRVDLAPGMEDGTACLQVIGPVPEILALARTLDAAARTVQASQRRALQDGTEIPVDPTGEVAETGMPLSLATLRYHLLTNAELDTDGAGIPTQTFRMNVTVPLMTLLGHSDAPGMLDGTIPIPADMARELAAGEDAWYRLLTDPATGEFLPAPAQRYSAPAAMREHLRVRMTTCAVPGCRRPASCATEADHIQEYDHADPLHGGRTAVENLHLLCWKHHALKTERRIDPVRVAAEHSPTGRTGTMWSIAEQMQVFQEDDLDLATPALVADLTASWAEVVARRERLRRQHPAVDDSSSDGTAPEGGPPSGAVQDGHPPGGGPPTEDPPGTGCAPPPF